MVNVAFSLMYSNTSFIVVKSESFVRLDTAVGIVGLFSVVILPLLSVTTFLLACAVEPTCPLLCRLS